MSIKLFGKYRGQVVDNLDPDQIGRLLVSVPDAFSGKTSWAMPCVPFAGNQSGFFALPPPERTYGSSSSAGKCVGVALQSITAISGGAAITDVTMTGSVTRRAPTKLFHFPNKFTLYVLNNRYSRP